jgi:hypothetical protein
MCKSNGACEYECATNIDCAEDSYCSANHQCVVGPRTLDAGGSVDAGAPSDASTKGCGANIDCDDGLFCNGEEQCVLGHCAPSADTPCDSHATCIQDTCDEATKTCSHTTLGSMDADGDAHFDQACGGDDCNDRDPTIFAGHPELCDGKDNDCDGLVDDYAVIARGTDYTSIGPESGKRDLWTSAFGQGSMTAKLDNQGNQSSYDVMPMTSGGVTAPDTMVLSHISTSAGSSRVVGFGGNIEPTPAGVLVYDLDNGNGLYTPRYATVITSAVADGGTTFVASAPITLIPNGVIQAGNADVDWTGSSFLVTWGQYNGGSLDGYFTVIDTDGTQATSVFPVPGGHLGNLGLSPVFLRAAVDASVYAFLYGQWTSYFGAATATVYLVSASGTTLAGPIAVPGAPLEITSFGSDFVALSQDASALYMTEISPAGNVVATASTKLMPAAAGTFAIDARGATDAQGIAFAVQAAAGTSGNGGSVRLVRARAGLTDPIQVSTAMQPVTTQAADRIGLSTLADGTLAISYWETATDGAVHVRIASCLP